MRNHEMKICKNNCLFFPVADVNENSLLEMTWRDRYIGRKVERGYFDTIFTQNGYYPQISNYADRGITLNLKVELDENDVIKNITYYKVQDSSPFYMRPQSTDLPLNKIDTSHFAKTLDSVTFDCFRKECKNFFKKLASAKELPHGFTVKEVGRKEVELLNSEGETVCLLKKDIEKALEISHSYIEILLSEEGLLKFSKTFEEDKVSAYAAVLSLVDYEEYPNKEELFKLKKLYSVGDSTKLAEEYYKLVAAIEACNIDEVKKYLDFALLHDADYYGVGLVNKCIEVNNIEIAELLIKNGAPTVPDPSEAGSESKVPLLCALKAKQYDMVRLLAENHGTKIKQILQALNTLKEEENWVLLRELIKYAYDENKGINPFPAANLPCSLKTIIIPFAKLDKARISWTEEHLEKAYHYSAGLCKQLLKQMNYANCLDLFVRLDDFAMFQYCLEHRAFRIENVDMEALLEKDEKWVECAKKHTVFSQWGEYITAGEVNYTMLGYIRQGKFDLYWKVAEAFRVSHYCDVADKLATAINPESEGIWEFLAKFIDVTFENIKYMNEDLLKLCLQHGPASLLPKLGRFIIYTPYEFNVLLFEYLLKYNKEQLKSVLRYALETESDLPFLMIERVGEYWKDPWWFSRKEPPELCRKKRPLAAYCLETLFSLIDVETFYSKFLAWEAKNNPRSDIASFKTLCEYMIFRCGVKDKEFLDYAKTDKDDIDLLLEKKGQ